MCAGKSVLFIVELPPLRGERHRIYTQDQDQTNENYALLRPMRR